MAMGGNSELKSSVEIFDVSPEGGTCTKPADFPDGRDLGKGSVGSFFNEMPTVCGGLEGGRECHGYDFGRQTWTKLPFLMLKYREKAAGVVVRNDSWIIFGGRLPSGSALSDSEVLKEGKFHPSSLWPIEFWGHCIVGFNETHSFVAGGRNENAFIRSSYMFLAARSYWTWVANMRYERSGHVCGITKSGISGRREIVVAGGREILESEIFSFVSNEWRDGHPLPHEMDMAQGVQTGESNFLIIGGSHFGRCPVQTTECFASRYVYEFGNERGWKLRNYSMEVSRSQFVAVTMPIKGLGDGTICSRNHAKSPGEFFITSWVACAQISFSKKSMVIGACGVRTLLVL